MTDDPEHAAAKPQDVHTIVWLTLCNSATVQAPGGTRVFRFMLEIEDENFDKSSFRIRTTQTVIDNLFQDLKRFISEDTLRK